MLCFQFCFIMASLNTRLFPTIKKNYTEGSIQDDEPSSSIHIQKQTNSLREYLKAKQIQNKQPRFISIESENPHKYLSKNDKKKEKFHPRTIQFSFALQKRKIGIEGGQKQASRKASQAVISKKPFRNQLVAVEIGQTQVEQQITVPCKRKQTSQNRDKTTQKQERQRFSFNSLILSDTENYYINDLKGKPYNNQKLTQFVYLLQQQNPFFARISMIITRSLLQIGSITSYAPGDVIYYQDKPIRSLGLILWGQALLKKKNPNWKFNLLCGSAIGEQVLFQTVEYRQRRSRSIEKGDLLTFEKCKAVGNCGILFIGMKQIAWMNEHLSLQGLKDQMLRFKSLLLRSYIKKREQRQIIG